MRLSYAQHLYRQQGATVHRAVVVTGRMADKPRGRLRRGLARSEGTDWHVAREDLGTEGVDAERVGRLARADASLTRAGLPPSGLQPPTST